MALTFSAGRDDMSVPTQHQATLPCLQTSSSLEQRGLVCALPGEVRLVAAKVAVGGGFAVNGSQQIEHVNNAFGSQVKVFEYPLDCFVS